MIKVMLDTNILIYATNNVPPAVFEKLASFKKGEVAVSSIAWAEYCVGVHKFGIDSSNIGELVDILPFNAEAADVYGELAAALSLARDDMETYIRQSYPAWPTE